MFEHIKFIKIPVMCQAVIVEPTPAEIDAGLYVVHAETDVGPIPRLRCRLCFAPGTDTNFKKGDAVMVMAELWYSAHEEKFKEIVHDGRHFIMGKHHPFGMKPIIPVKNINADLAGGSYRFLHPMNHCGVVVEDNGAVNIVTDGLVHRRMSPRGFGINEESDIALAQNHSRVVMNQVRHMAREYFGMSRGDSSSAMKSNATDSSGSKMLIAYKRFVPRSLDPNYWVSTCEGAYAPWIGPNNEVGKLKDADGTIFSKVIHAKDTRVTITGGKPGRDFFNIRVDKVVPGSEKMVGKGPDCTPPASKLRSSISISSDGDVVAEIGVADTRTAAAILKITKDGTISLTSTSAMKFITKDMEVEASSFKMTAPKIELAGAVNVKGPLTVNGKNLAMADFVDFFKSYLSTLFTGSPAVINPGAASEFSLKSALKATYKTDAANTAVAPVVATTSETLPLKSTG